MQPKPLLRGQTTYPGYTHASLTAPILVLAKGRRIKRQQCTSWRGPGSTGGSTEGYKCTAASPPPAAFCQYVYDAMVALWAASYATGVQSRCMGPHRSKPHTNLCQETAGLSLQPSRLRYCCSLCHWLCRYSPEKQTQFLFEVTFFACCRSSGHSSCVGAQEFIMDGRLRCFPADHLPVNNKTISHNLSARALDDPLPVERACS